MAEFLTEMGNEYKIAVNRPYNFSAIWNLGTAMIKKHDCCYTTIYTKPEA